MQATQPNASTPQNISLMQELHTPPSPPSEHELAALQRLITLAQAPTGQGRRAADFLLAWWDAGRCGGFDLTNLWAVDRAVAQDMTVVFGLIARVEKYPLHINEALDAQFQAIAKTWGPNAS